MKRRMFISTIGLTALAIGTQANALLTLTAPSTANTLDLKNRLAPQLSAYFHPKFQTPLKETSMKTLYQDLLAKGVINSYGVVNSTNIAACAQEDAIVSYGGKYYTKTELHVFSLAYLACA